MSKIDELLKLVSTAFEKAETDKDEIDRRIEVEKLVKEAANEHNELKKAYTDLARSATFENKGVEKVNSEPKNESRTFEEALKDFVKRQKK